MALQKCGSSPILPIFPFPEGRGQADEIKKAARKGSAFINY